MADHAGIEARPRQVTGKAVRHLRREGWVPAVLYGHGIESLPIQVEAMQLDRLLGQTGGKRLLQLHLDGDIRTVLPREVQRDVITRRVLHVDFQQVVMTERITSRVPIVLVGESPAVEDHRGILVQALNDVEIRALPDDLVDRLEVDVSGLSEPDDAIHLRDLAIPSTVEVAADPDETVARILPLREEEEEEEEELEVAAEPELIRRAAEEEEAAREREKAPAPEAPEPQEDRDEEQGEEE